MKNEQTIETCSICGKSLGSMVQEGLFGKEKKRCTDCETRARIEMIFAVLPEEGTDEFDDLRESTQEFLFSVRRYFQKHHTLTGPQYDVLEQIYTQCL